MAVGLKCIFWAKHAVRETGGPMPPLPRPAATCGSIVRRQGLLQPVPRGLAVAPKKMRFAIWSALVYTLWLPANCNQFHKYLWPACMLKPMSITTLTSWQALESEQEKNKGLPALDIQLIRRRLLCLFIPYLTSKECWTKHETKTHFGYASKRIQPCSTLQEQVDAWEFVVL